MQIIIVQAEIEEAIRTHINNLIVVRDGKRIDIELAATRGVEGFKATIDIVDSDAPPQNADRFLPDTRGPSVLEAEKDKGEQSKSLGIGDKIAAAKAEDEPDPATPAPARRGRPPKVKTEEPVKQVQEILPPETTALDEGLNEGMEAGQADAQDVQEDEPVETGSTDELVGEAEADQIIEEEQAAQPAVRPSLFSGLKHPKTA